jgi:epoxyqueuosine reductase
VSADVAAAIKSFALHELGFSLAGISSADPLPGGARLADWVRRDNHGTMAFLADTAAVRRDPRLFLSGARSVVCVAMSYHEAPDPQDLAGAGERAVVARYARRPDYHRVIRARLVRLGRFLAEQLPGAAWRPAVDTAPLLEKELAQRAGLGWIGKNTCLINRSLGSELLLGELVTDAALPPDPPETDQCGTCSACLTACPSGAFAAARRLDARRCLAYATIEHRGGFPAELRSSLGNRLFGCDACQSVCPWNRRAASSCVPALAARAQLAALSRAQLERIDRQGWAAVAAGTPLRRLDFPRLRSNLDAIAFALEHGGRA